MEAGPLVKGVSDAVHQSFPSEEEARRVFALAFSRGHTRIVGDRPSNANQHRSPQPPPTFSSGSASSNSYSNESFSAMSSTSSTKIISTYLSPPQHRPQANSAHEFSNSKKSFKPESSSNLRPISYILSEPAHISSHHTTSDRPYNNTKKPTEIVPIETRVLKEDTRVSTPEPDPTGLSPSLKRPSRRPCAIVKTPSWLPSYPKSPQPLSPLDHEYLSLNNFRTGGFSDRDQGIDFKPNPSANSSSPSGSSMYCTRTPRTSTLSPQNNGSVSNSSISFSPPVRHIDVVHEQGKDPRSPMLSPAKVPVSGLK